MLPRRAAGAGRGLTLPLRRLAVALALTAGLAPAASAASASFDATRWTLQSLLPEHSDLSLSGSLRARQESLGGQFRPGLGAATDALALRTTLGLEYRFDRYWIGGEIIDSRYYGVDRDSAVGTAEVNTFELVRAYIVGDFGDVLGPDTDLLARAGRFTIDVGSRRLVARNHFRNTTNAFTGLQLRWRDARQRRATAFLTLPQQRLPEDEAGLLENRIAPDRERFSEVFWGAFFEMPAPPLAGALEFSVFGLHERDRASAPTRNRQLLTLESRLLEPASNGDWDYELEGAYQVGQTRATAAGDAERLDVSAFFYRLQFGYTFDAIWSPRIAVAHDRASGNRPGNGSWNRFDTLFGARRMDFGPTALYGPLGRSNLLSVETLLETRPTLRWDWMLAWRANWLDQRTDVFAATGVRDASGAAGRFAGYQFETRLGWWLVPERVRLEAGGAAFLQGRYFDDAPNASGHGDTLYGYTSVTTSF